MKSSKARNGLEFFVCRRCGNCCTGDGFVSVSREECRRMADYLGLALEAFLEIYTRRKSAEEYWLKDGEGEDQPCVFLERDTNLASCRIESAAKPDQCRAFPTQWRRPGFEQWCAGMKAGKSES